MKFFSLMMGGLIALSSVTSFAKASDHSLLFFPANKEIRYEKDSNEEYTDRNPNNFQIAYMYKKFGIALEYSQFAEETGNSTSSIYRKHEEVQVWGNYSFYQYLGSGFDFRFNLGMGAGLQQDHVDSTFNSVTRSDLGKQKILTGLSVGALYAVSLSDAWLVSAAAEGRSLFSSEFNPNPLWVLVLRLGIGFKF